MKVLFLLYRGNPFCGGQGIYLYNLTKELSKLGVEIDILVGPPYPDPMEDWATVYRLENLHLWMVKTKSLPHDKLLRLLSPWNFVDYLLSRFHVFPEMQTFSMRAFSSMQALLKHKQYDLIHDIQTLGWGMIPMKGYGIPMITTVHHPLTRDRDADLMMNNNFWDKLTTVLFYPLIMQRFVIKRLDRVITSFRKGVDELHSAFGLRKDKISVVYNGMDVELFTNTGEPREENQLLFVGNGEDYKKGMIFLLEALKMLPEHIHLTIVDEGPPGKKKAWDMVVSLGLEKRVTFTGKVSYERLVSLYSTKTLVVMSSLYEGFGLPAAEAMSCKTPVVATAVGALKEIVPPEAGILVPPKDPAALKEAILILLADKKRRQKMGEFGRKWTVANYAWPVAARNTLEIYNDVINGQRRKK
ncbi:MAG: hypothetical protein CVV44_00760 [Spirochaetae bacterium HGW-Spirochaetae-1]|jgi:glycosyltransferase involved in cell wall biosynthesis|nr:MAG: hypothetical protein CVV44_00760 [Spirochaetae bacterium HGW-Spirochaetae-1]